MQVNLVENKGIYQDFSFTFCENDFTFCSPCFLLLLRTKFNFTYMVRGVWMLIVLVVGFPVMLVAQDTVRCRVDSMSYFHGIRIAQLSKEMAELKGMVNHRKWSDRQRFLAAASFMDAAIGSANNLHTMLLKETYRNKVTSLNNPSSGELGFNLELEIKHALKPLIEKLKKVERGKLLDVVGSLFQVQQGAGALFPAANIFTCVVSLVGNLSINNKKIPKKDIDEFLVQLNKYFTQYEKLHECNFIFQSDIQRLKSTIFLLQEDIRVQLQDFILSLQKTIKRDQLKLLTSEELLLQYFDDTYIDSCFNQSLTSFPSDALKSCKEIASRIHRTYREYLAVYQKNYTDINTIINLKESLADSFDKNRLQKTMHDLEVLYKESKLADEDNLRFKTLTERLELMQY